MKVLQTSNIKDRETFLIIECPLCHHKQTRDVTGMAQDERHALARGNLMLDRLIDAIMQYLRT